MNEAVETLLVSITLVVAFIVLVFIIVKYFYPMSEYGGMSEQDRLAYHLKPVEVGLVSVIYNRAFERTNR